VDFDRSFSKLDRKTKCNQRGEGEAISAKLSIAGPLRSFEERQGSDTARAIARFGGSGKVNRYAFEMP
jgi:hypothetical protein